MLDGHVEEWHILGKAVSVLPINHEPQTMEQPNSCCQADFSTSESHPNVYWRNVPFHTFTRCPGTSLHMTSYTSPALTLQAKMLGWGGLNTVLHQSYLLCFSELEVCYILVMTSTFPVVSKCETMSGVWFYSPGIYTRYAPTHRSCGVVCWADGA